MPYSEDLSFSSGFKFARALIVHLQNKDRLTGLTIDRKAATAHCTFLENAGVTSAPAAPSVSYDTSDGLAFARALKVRIDNGSGLVWISLSGDGPSADCWFQ